MLADAEFWSNYIPDPDDGGTTKRVDAVALPADDFARLFGGG